MVPALVLAASALGAPHAAAQTKPSGLGAAPAPQLLPQANTPETLTTAQTFAYRGDFDTNGILYHLGTVSGAQPYQNPALRGAVTVTASSVAADSQPASAVAGRQTVRFTTLAQPGSWVQVDLGNLRVRPTNYTLRHYSSWDTEALRSWVLEGSNDASSWTALRTHSNDTALNAKGATKTWDIESAPGTYRYFRVRQTGLNSNNHHYLALSGFELYGVLHTPTLVKVPARTGVAAAAREYVYQSDEDGNGVVRGLGTNDKSEPFKNPMERGLMLVTSSSAAPNVEAPADILNNVPIRFATGAQPGSWVQFDFRGRRIAPTRYGLRHYTSWDTEALRHWVLEGSTDGTNWTTLSTHTNDTALNAKGVYRTWAITGNSGAFSIFRVRMTGLNSNKHFYLSLAGFEIYGTMTPSPGVALPSSGYVYQSDFDDRGLIGALGTAGGKQPYQNPMDRGVVAVTASSVATGSALNAVVGNRAARFSTNPIPNSWVQIDLKGRSVIPTHYSLRHYDSWDTEALRSWVLEGSKDGAAWAALMTHSNDVSLNAKGATKTWTLPRSAESNAAYRFFRVRQTGPNSNNHHYLALSGFEIYGLMIGAAP
jgi:hypothetical protein